MFAVKHQPQGIASRSLGLLLLNEFRQGFLSGWTLFWSPFAAFAGVVRTVWSRARAEASDSPVNVAKPPSEHYTTFVMESGRSTFPQDIGRHERVRGEAPEDSYTNILFDFGDTVPGSFRFEQGSVHLLPEVLLSVEAAAGRLQDLSTYSIQLRELTRTITTDTERTALNVGPPTGVFGAKTLDRPNAVVEVKQLVARASETTNRLEQLAASIREDAKEALAEVERSMNLVNAMTVRSESNVAIEDVDRASRRLAELIDEISAVANVSTTESLAGSVRRYYDIDSTASAVHKIRELARIVELCKSVLRRAA